MSRAVAEAAALFDVFVVFTSILSSSTDKKRSRLTLPFVDTRPFRGIRLRL